jgi:hypothetical protein
MQKKTTINKSLAVGIILLFIGIAVAPSINFTVAKASNDNDLVEVTTQACGIKGYENTTVKLTREHYQNLEQYLIEFRARLNQTTTREEAVPIFNEAVVELNKYGLLPKGMSVEQAQRVITVDYQNKNMIKLQEKLLHSRLLAQDNNSNYFCLIAGKSNDCRSIGPLGLSVQVFLFLFFHLLYAIYDMDIFIILNVIMLVPMYEHSAVRIFNLLGALTFGHHYTVTNYPSTGWVFTYGLMGKKLWNNTFIGGLFHTFVEPSDIGSYSCVGASGFSGIRILFPDETTSHFIGSALRVKLISE